VLGAKLGHFLDKPLAPLARLIPLSPNIITLVGFAVTIAAAASIPFNLLIGGLLILLGGFFDMLDGIVARINEKKSRFGAFLDSTLDRYSDSFIFIAIAWLFYEQGNAAGSLFAVGGLAGALIISYAKARAEGLGIGCDTGIMERPERILLLALGCITGWLYYTVVLLFFLNHATALQRIIHVYRMSR
jgi:phosphatidylglycerophosphate synthase